MSLHETIANQRRVDFLARRKEEKIFVEVTSVNPDMTSASAQSRLDTIVREINEKLVDIPYFVHYQVHRYGEASPSTRWFVGQLRRIANAAETSNERSISRILEREGWRIEFTLTSRTSQSTRSGAIGSFSSYGYVNPIDAMRRGLESKAKAYGVPEGPFCLVISDFDETHVILGSEDYVRTSFGQDIMTMRHPDFQMSDINGFFSQDRRREHISGVVFFYSDPYWDAKSSQREPLIVHNPFANYVFL